MENADCKFTAGVYLTGPPKGKREAKEGMALHCRLGVHLCQMQKTVVVGNAQGNPRRRGQNRVLRPGC